MSLNYQLDMNLWIFLASKKMNGEIIFLIQVLVQQVAFRDIFYQKKRSSFKEGYKIISFYIDAESLLKRAYVLRQEGWRKKENVGYYQRMLDAKKIVSMRRYLSSERRVFINNIITTISENDIRMYKDQNRREEIVIDENGNFVGDNKRTNVTPAYVEILNKCNIIGIIDGQHRTLHITKGMMYMKNL